MEQRKKKRTVLTLEDEVNAKKRMEQGTPAYKTATELGVEKTQIQNLRKRKQELISDFKTMHSFKQNDFAQQL